MKLITPFEPKLSTYMIPPSLTTINFYDMAAVDVPRSLLDGTPRQLTVIELLEDPSGTKFLTLSEVKVRGNHWADSIDERAYSTLAATGELAAWLRRASRESVPDGIEVKHEHLIATMAEHFSAKWWEVSW